jgi:hypothetical protein
MRNDRPELAHVVQNPISRTAACLFPLRFTVAVAAILFVEILNAPPIECCYLPLQGMVAATFRIV